MPSSLTPQGHPPLERQFFRAPTVLTGILPVNRAQAVGSGEASAASGQGLSPMPPLLCPMNHGRVSCAGTGLLEHRLLSAHLPADLQYALFCKSHCRASLQCPRARLPLRHSPSPPPHHHSRARAGETSTPKPLPWLFLPVNPTFYPGLPTPSGHLIL